MHQLHFMADLVGGAEYVLNVLDRMLPCEGVIIHVFDINAREFVVVRAKGPGATTVLLQRTPDTFALFRDAFRRTRAVHITGAAENEGFQGERWERLGVVPKDVVLAAVRQGGRYLGMLEVANPDGEAPFYVSELNALDYIAEQFASFVATKPIVLDEDAVVPRGR
jgi:GAF domain-containing protein